MILALNAGLRFLLELAALCALGFWGARLEAGLTVRLGLGIGVPLLATVIWGMFGAPAAAHRLPEMARRRLELAIFAAGAGALMASGYPTLGWLLAAVAAANSMLLSVLGQR